jgi:tRNA1Val (adenine37-N6)-methyltransferase
MANSYFRFKQFTIHHDRCAMKVTTDACLFGAWAAEAVANKSMATGNEQGGDKSVHLLDIGAGTGLLSLVTAQKINAWIDAVEIDAAAAEQAKENISASPWKGRITVLHQDLLQWQTEKRYDIILSNPPFYKNDLKAQRAEKNLAHHDAGLPLPALLTFIKMHLKKDGLFFLLLPAKREKETDLLLRQAGLFLQQKVRVQQTPNHPPFRVMIRGGCHKGDGVEEPVVIIRNEAGEYMPAFVSLLKEYYLYL